MLSREAPRVRRRPQLAVRALAACAVLLLAAGCGGDEGSDSVAEAETELAIAVDPDGDGNAPALEAELACPGANASQAACDAVEELPPDPTAPVPASTACTEIFGGPDTITITGTLRGEPVDARLSRANGCEIDRFDRFGPLLAILFPDYEPGSALSP